MVANARLMALGAIVSSGMALSLLVIRPTSNGC
jgi:hypothetical protein